MSTKPNTNKADIEAIMFTFSEKLKYRRDVQKNLLLVMAAIIIVFTLYHFGALSFLRGASATNPVNHESRDTCMAWDVQHVLLRSSCRIQSRYPLTPPIKTQSGTRFRISVIADLDEERSKVPNKSNTWRSYMKNGYLTKHDNGEYTVKWEPQQVTLTTHLNEKGRGLELSDLGVFNSKLYTVDDRTGIVYQIINNGVIPWVILNDGPGLIAKGFKSEWMTVKDGALYVGGLGKEWTTKEGAFVNYHPMFVKSIDQYGTVVHHNWTDVYLNVRATVGIKFPGYMVHEAVAWSPVRRRWYFLPRRMSFLKYDDVTDEQRGTNVLIHCNENFQDFRFTYVGKLEQTHGFSSFKFVPGTGDEICVALKSVEYKGDISSYIMVFKIDGTVLMQETLVDYNKFEGVEFT